MLIKFNNKMQRKKINLKIEFPLVDFDSENKIIFCTAQKHDQLLKLKVNDSKVTLSQATLDGLFQTQREKI